MAETSRAESSGARSSTQAAAQAVAAQAGTAPDKGKGAPPSGVQPEPDPMPGGALGALAAEFAGTLILILFGVGVVAQVAAAGIGNHDSIAWAWGLGVTLGVYVAARASGAHLNPAVTVALAAFGDFPWRRVAPYALAQTAGAFVAALIVRWNYAEVLAKADPEHTIKTQGVFSTLPGNGELPVGTWGAFRDQIIGTAILLFLVLAITDARNDGPAANLAPVVIGLVVVAIGMAWGTNAGYAINPARDFGPRLASFLTGYGGAWRDQYGQLYFWVPIIAPLLGGVLGAGLYKVLVGRFLPPAGDPVPEPAPSPARVPAEAA
ncbi:MIP/aquaporin family protein [Actinomadura sp. 9N407]|uniref:MIP/aquaporin family protein n=1 Tax=Actinomadura sp. 9N407 TaxID=3375154 RepID=UPI0037B8D5FB